MRRTSAAASRRRSRRSPSTTCRRSKATISGIRTTAPNRRYSRAALIGVIAAREAWADAGLRIGEPNAGVVIGSGGGGIDIGERQYHDFFVERGKKVTPYAIPVSIVGMVSSEISISLRLHGISHVLSCGCTSSTDAIGYLDRAAEVGRGRPDRVGRHRRVRHAGDDLRLLADARRVHGASSGRRKRRGRSTRGATASCSAKAPG
jgi:3-oxoacyl-(acyl-carrier-protein) synthase